MEGLLGMMCLSSKLFRGVLTSIFVLAAAASTGAADTYALASSWVTGEKAKARLVSGLVDGGTGGGRLFAFVEIALEPGWKTYWRTPGDAGGLPPSFDWSKSSNLAKASVLFPAPERFVDKSGATIGYKDSLVLPVEILPERADQPVSLVVGLSYGICKDVCIPVEAELVLDIEPGSTEPAPAEAVAALAQVPRAQDALKAGDPVIVRTEGATDGATPKITVAARFSDGDGGADAFLEAGDGLFLPLPDRVGSEADGVIVFEAPLGPDVDLAALKGKTVSVTVVGETGASYATFTLK